MRFGRLPLWCLVAVLILFVSPTTCETLPEPLCHPALGRNLRSSHCLEAIRRFHIHKDGHLRPYDHMARPSKKIFYFGNHLTVRVTAGQYVRLPFSFSHEGCTITIAIAANARRELVPISWGSVSNAVQHLYRKCVQRVGAPLTGGTLEYQGLEILITQSPQAGDYAPRSVRPVPAGYDLTEINDLIDRLYA
jgi:hypothetical protein